MTPNELSYQFLQITTKRIIELNEILDKLDTNCRGREYVRRYDWNMSTLAINAKWRGLLLYGKHYVEPLGLDRKQLLEDM